MNRIIVTLIAALFTTLVSAQLKRVEPPSWWVGMNHSELQVMFFGDDIGGLKISVDYPGVNIISVEKAENEDYLFLNLNIEKAQPGTMLIEFADLTGKVVTTCEYKLLEREPGSAGRCGFDNSDVMYLVMPDRFANGNPGNDVIDGMKEGLNRKMPFGRHGGDIKGIADNLDYISNMGFTAIWLNPVLENDMKDWSYHGYAATDFYRVDRRFGTNEEYRDLVKKAGEKGIKLIMDMIFNHCGLGHWWMEKPPFSDWINNYPDYIITNHRRTVNMDPNASGADIRGMTDGWFVPSMPDLNQRNPYMAEYLIQNSIWWIEYTGIAGIRMDTYPYPDKVMMAEWNRRVLNEYPRFTIVGEEWSVNPAIVSYWQRGQVNRDGYDGMIPSMMDFPLQKAVSDGLLQKEDWGTGLITIYEALANDFLYPDPSGLVIFPDNHDMPRFYMQLGMDKDLYRLGITFFLTTRGIPQIFYGSEILMTHTEGNDHGNIRKDFPGGWEGDRVNGFTGAGLGKEEQEMQNFFRKILNWRKGKNVIHSGKMMHFAPVNGIYVYFRYNETDRVMVILNKNEKRQSLDPGRFAEMIGGYSYGRDILSERDINLDDNIELEPLTPMIIEIR